jgi:hypothetical protein
LIFLSGREGDGHGLPLLRKPFAEIDLINATGSHQAEPGDH